MNRRDDTTKEIVRLLKFMPSALQEVEGGVVPQQTGRALCAAPFPSPLQTEKWQPKRLTPKHRQILSLYAQGMKREDIGSLCKCTPTLVTMLAACNLGRAYLQSIEEAMDQRLRALYSKTIDAIDDQLCNGRGADKIAAAKLQLQATGKLGRSAEEGETAEDVIQRILNMQVNGDINVTVHAGPPARIPIPPQTAPVEPEGDL